jgi:hypothetical protein
MADARPDGGLFLKQRSTKPVRFLLYTFIVKYAYSIRYLRVPITQRKYLFRNYTTNHTTPADRFTTGTTMQC